MLGRWIDGFLLAPLRVAAAEQRGHVAASAGTDWRVAVVLTTTALMLTAQAYLFRGSNLATTFRAIGTVLPEGTLEPALNWSLATENDPFSGLAYWAFGQVTVYVLGPMLVIKLLFRERMADYGAKLRGMTSCWWAYLAMAAVMLPCVLLASGTERFQQTYPFYHLREQETLGWRFFAWELMYAVQFVSLEFFFRGFVLHGTRRRFGAYSIYVMMVPYCMIHFGKPPLETLGAIGAGIVLGFMSLKTRSIWMGAALHIFVAWTMDTAALWRAGRL